MIRALPGLFSYLFYSTDRSKSYSLLLCGLFFVCVEVLRPSQPNGVMSSAVGFT